MIEKKNGKVLELFISRKGQQDRVSRTTINLDEEGIIDDKFYAKGASRSVLVTSKESYDLAKKSSISAPFGSLGENILIDINPYALPSGNQIQIGEVILEITQNCTICNSLAKVHKDLPKVLKDDRGVFAKVVKSGSIHKGDLVTILI